MKILKKTVNTILVIIIFGSHSCRGRGLQIETEIIDKTFRAVANTVTDGMITTVSIASENIAKTAPSIGLDAAKELAPALAKIGEGCALLGQAAMIGAQVYAVHEGYTIAKDIGSHFFPDEVVQKNNETTKTKRRLRECLMENHNGERGRSGRPMVCENEARMFAMIAGKQKLDEMTATFTELYGK